MKWSFHSLPNGAPAFKHGAGDRLIDCLLSASHAVEGVSYWERRYLSKDLIIYFGKYLTDRVGLLLVYGENFR